MKTSKKRFIVEIEAPEGIDRCWDEDKTGLWVFQDCITAKLPEISLEALVQAKDMSPSSQEYTNICNAVRKSFKVIKPLENSNDEFVK